MRCRALALAALLTGAPGLAVPAAGEIVWIEICGARHPGVRIPLPLRDDRERAPAKACHAACGILADRRQAARR